MKRRENVLGAIRFAGYHNDSREAIRLALDNRVSNAVLRREFAAGARHKADGMGCGCHECRKTVRP